MFKGIAIEVIEKENSSSNQKLTVLKRWITSVNLLPGMIFMSLLFVDKMYRVGGLPVVLLLVASGIVLILKFNPVSLAVTTVNNNSSGEDS